MSLAVMWGFQSLHVSGEVITAVGAAGLSPGVGNPAWCWALSTVRLCNKLRTLRRGVEESIPVSTNAVP